MTSPRRIPRSGVALFCGVMAVAGAVSAVLVWQFLQPADTTPRVPYADFLAQVRQGHVTDVHVDGGVYAFTVYDRATHRSQQLLANGPVPDIALVRSWMASAPEGHKFNVYFER